MERMLKNGTYEIHKQRMILRYHEKIKNNIEERLKRTLYYKRWYNINKEKIQEKRRILYHKNKNIRNIKNNIQPRILSNIIRFD